MRHSVQAAIAAGLLGLIAGTACADLITIEGSPENSTEGFGNFSGTIDYSFQSGNTGHLAVSLTNTTDPGIGGYITAFVFNIGAPEHSGTDTATLLLSSHSSMVDIPGPAISGAPFGSFDAGVGIGADFEGGGRPTGGIGVGSTGLFEFEVNSAFADVLTASSFLSGPNEFDFVVRFRGFDNEGSDKVPAVPVPGSVALLGMGAIAIGARSRRDR